MNTPRHTRQLNAIDIVRRGDFIRQGDSCYEYCQEFGSEVSRDFRYRKVQFMQRVWAFIDSFGGREGL